MEPQVNDCVAIDLEAFLRDTDVLGSFKSCHDLLSDDRTFVVEAVSGSTTAISTGFHRNLFAPIPIRHLRVDWRPKHRAGDVLMLIKNPDFTAAPGWRGYQALLHCGRLVRVLGPYAGRIGAQGYNVHAVGDWYYSSVDTDVRPGRGDAIYVFSESSLVALEDPDGAALWLESIDADRRQWWGSDPPRISREKAELILFGEQYKSEERRAQGLWTCSWHHNEVPDRVPALYKSTNGTITAL